MWSWRSRMPGSADAIRSLTAIRPPGRHAATSCESAWRGSSKWWNEKRVTAPSNEPGSTGRSSASPRTKSMLRTPSAAASRRPASSIAWVASTHSTRPTRRASVRPTSPVPAATSIHDSRGAGSMRSTSQSSALVKAVLRFGSVKVSACSVNAARMRALWSVIVLTVRRLHPRSAVSVRRRARLGSRTPTTRQSLVSESVKQLM